MYERRKIKKNERDGVTFLTFPLLEQAGVLHGFSTRLGGVSQGDLGTMNLSFSRGDERERVCENHRRFASAVGYPMEWLVFSDQVHDTVIRRVAAPDGGKGILCESDLKGVDGLVTDDPEVVLMTFFADCVPLLFYDQRHGAVGAAHSGWRGTVRRMGARMVEAMKEEFGTEPGDLLAVIGPSICQDCYEVGGDVAGAFGQAFTEKQSQELLRGEPGGKYRLNLWRANEIILEEAGMPNGQIQTCGLCTCCHPDVLFSHRASGGRRGNLAGVISPQKGYAGHGNE